MQQDMATVIEQTRREFCLNLLADPCSFYIEHGLQALFFTQVYSSSHE